jgi:polyhydroxybutyrate depolymerase
MRTGLAMTQKAIRSWQALVFQALACNWGSRRLYCGRNCRPCLCLGGLCLGGLGLLALGLLALGLLAPSSVLAQTQWEFVPGSRQARPVTKTQAQGAPSVYAPHPARSGGMQLRTAPVSSATVASPVPASSSLSSVSTTQSTTRVIPQRQPASTGQRSITPTRQKSYDYQDTMEVDGSHRIFRVHIPPSYDRTKPTPVVLAFHGLGMNSLAMMAMSGFNGLADRKGFIVVYGEGLNNRWNDGTGGGADDIAYVSALLKKLAREANIDPRRVYACGIPDKIAAVGVVASTMIASSMSAMNSSSRMPIVFFLGSEDPLLPWGDGRNKELGKLGESLGLSGLGSIDNPMARVGGLVSVPEMIQFWTNHNGCGGSPSIMQMPNLNAKDGTTVKRETYGSGDVVVYVIDGGGHTWPGMIEVSSFKELCGLTCQDIDASEILWDFFQHRSR